MNSFNPPRRTLMGPGPSDVHPRVLSALARPTVGHLDPTFLGMMDEVKDMLRYVFRTENDFTLPISAPGSAGMETCLVNLVEPGDTVIVCVNGVFGGRMKEIVSRCGGTPVEVEDKWGDPVDLQKAEDALNANPGARAICWVDGETSTGARSDSKALCALAAKHGTLSVIDAVTSLGGTPVLVDEWGADAVYGGSQKCLSCVPGIAPVTFGDRAVERIRGRNTPVQSWFLDLNLVMGYWGEGAKRTYHHTAPVNALYALHESLVMMREEGIQDGWARHRRMHNALAAGMEAMGLSLFVDEAHRLPQLNAVAIPEGVDEAAVRARLLNEYGLEIGAGLGGLAGKVWRIGLMGQSATSVNVTLCLGALEHVLASSGADINVGAALPAASGELV